MYCVERVKEPFAEYVSCNGPDTEHYTCTCNNWIDRCIARDDTSVCNASHLDDQQMPACKCSDSSLIRSSKVIGRMPVRILIVVTSVSSVYRCDNSRGNYKRKQCSCRSQCSCHQRINHSYSCTLYVAVFYSHR